MADIDEEKKKQSMRNKLPKMKHKKVEKPLAPNGIP